MSPSTSEALGLLGGWTLGDCIQVCYTYLSQSLSQALGELGGWGLCVAEVKEAGWEVSGWRLDFMESWEERREKDSGLVWGRARQGPGFQNHYKNSP